MRLTKLQMAKVIVQALYMLPELPADDHPEVIKQSRNTVARLTGRHKLAVDALLSTLAKRDFVCLGGGFRGCTELCAECAKGQATAISIC